MPSVREVAGFPGAPCGRRSPGLGVLPLLGGSWVVISGVISRVTIIITPIRGLITPLITTHEPPSGALTIGFRFWD